MAKNQRLNASITIGSVLEGSVKKNISFLKSGLSQVGSAIKDVERRQRELAKQRKVLEKEGRSVEELDREYQDLERTLGKLRRAQERWTNASHAANRVGKTFSAMTTDIGRQARRLAVGGGLAATAIFGVASSTAQLGDDVAKTADKLGIGTGALQELRYAAERSGVSTGEFDKSLEKMTKNIGLAMEGTGAQKDALDALGLSAADLADMLPDDALAAIADRLTEVETTAERAAIANDLFGRSGIGMLNMLRDGSKGLNDLRDDARETGYVLEEEAARNAEVFQDSLLDLQLVGKGLKNTIGAELMPVVTQTMQEISGWLVSNRAEVKEWAGAFADGVERAIPVVRDLASGVGRVTRTVSKSVTKVAEMVGGWENFGVIIGGVLASGTIMKVVKFGGAVFSLGKAMVGLSGVLPLVAGGIKAIGVAMIANPVGAIIAAIAGAAYLIYKNWEPIKAFFLNLWEKVKETFESAKNRIGEIWDGLKQNIADGVAGVKEAWAGVKEGIGSVLDWLASKFEWVMGIIQPVIDALRWVQNAPGKAGRWVADKLWGGSDEPVQERASGGFFRPGAVLTGEKGPELMYQNRAGWVADNRAMRSLADYAGKVSGIMQGGGMQAAAQAAVTHVHQYTVNAQGVSAQQLIEMLDQRARQASQGGLFDRVPATGMWGR
ncbi:hypothetical protein GCM10016455_05440 [Aliiroseovarius zhejiangensis]|uniref:Phage tail tape measure protein n=1 Tax=Aliiroseovarius zhejiangensis TaxID=1632025 RepID=A0ABQ3IMT8_9RHOB|nr:hypothetical protein [Aliiroseovarius zhejiangensis]GHE88222.1 hypothetical protein GCM10016455_05440 [Aliiroseovarius zhejiangensis]